MLEAGLDSKASGVKRLENQEQLLPLNIKSKEKRLKG
jgi:hypothetical protein